MHQSLIHSHYEIMGENEGGEGRKHSCLSLSLIFSRLFHGRVNPLKEKLKVRTTGRVEIGN